MTVIPCTCLALCDYADGACEGFVKPIGLAPGGKWVHACKVHQKSRTIAGEYLLNYTDDDWQLLGPDSMPSGLNNDEVVARKQASLQQYEDYRNRIE